MLKLAIIQVKNKIKQFLYKFYIFSIQFAILKISSLLLKFDAVFCALIQLPNEKITGIFILLL